MEAQTAPPGSNVTMARMPDLRIGEEEIAAFWRDGAVCLRGLFTDWLEPLARGVEANMAAPGPVVKPTRSRLSSVAEWQRVEGEG